MHKHPAGPCLWDFPSPLLTCLTTCFALCWFLLCGGYAATIIPCSNCAVLPSVSSNVPAGLCIHHPPSLCLPFPLSTSWAGVLKTSCPSYSMCYTQIHPQNCISITNWNVTEHLIGSGGLRQLETRPPSLWNLYFMGNLMVKGSKMPAFVTEKYYSIWKLCTSVQLVYYYVHGLFSHTAIISYTCLGSPMWGKATRYSLCRSQPKLALWHLCLSPLCMRWLNNVLQTFLVGSLRRFKREPITPSFRSAASKSGDGSSLGLGWHICYANWERALLPVVC